MLNFLMKIYITFTGVLMGMADTLPGISGSTITYILGVYEEFIDAINGFTKKDTFKESFKFLFKLGIGWIIGAVISILLITQFAEDHIYFITSLFLGLLVATIIMNFLELKGKSKFTFKDFLLIFLGFYITMVIFFFGGSLMKSISGFSLYIYVFFVGILAISCMLLPGVSGSTIFLIFGLYSYILGTLGSILKGEFINLDFLFVLILGVVIGALFFAKIVSHLFKRQELYTRNFILGVLIGSIIPIVYTPFTMPKGNYSLLNFSNVSYVGLILGILVLVLLNVIKMTKDRKENNEN